MAATGEQQGREYLERYKIPELLHNLSALLLYHRPGTRAPLEARHHPGRASAQGAPASPREAGGALSHWKETGRGSMPPPRLLLPVQGCQRVAGSVGNA